MFDEYTEEVNNVVTYGVLYTKRVLSNPYDISTVNSYDEERLTLALKMNALMSIKDDCNEEYNRLLEQYNNMVGVIDGEV